MRHQETNIQAHERHVSAPLAGLSYTQTIGENATVEFSRAPEGQYMEI